MGLTEDFRPKSATRGSGGERSGKRTSRRDFLRGSGLAAAAVIAGSVPGAFGSSASGQTTTTRTAKIRRGGTLRCAFSGGGSADELDGQDPFTEIDNARVFQLFEPLVGFNQQAQSELVLAEEITPNATATSWTIRVRKGVTFHNGKHLGADDVAYSLRRILNPKAPLPGAALLSRLDLRGMRTLDSRTIQIPCHAPFSTFIDTMSTRRSSISCPLDMCHENPSELARSSSKALPRASRAHSTDSIIIGKKECRISIKS